MARLIDAKFAQHIANVELSPDIAGTVQWVLSHTPTVVAVEVVRCKDCKFWGQDVCGSTGEDESFCTNPDGLDNFAHPDDFCSYGERKDGDVNG